MTTNNKFSLQGLVVALDEFFHLEPNHEPPFQFSIDIVYITNSETWHSGHSIMEYKLFYTSPDKWHVSVLDNRLQGARFEWSFNHDSDSWDCPESEVNKE